MATLRESITTENNATRSWELSRALQSAVQSSDLTKAREALQAGANPDVLFGIVTTTKIESRFIEANPNSYRQYHAQIYIAISSYMATYKVGDVLDKRLAMVKLLLEHGAKVYGIHLSPYTLFPSISLEFPYRPLEEESFPLEKILAIVTELLRTKVDLNAPFINVDKENTNPAAEWLKKFIGMDDHARLGENQINQIKQVLLLLVNAGANLITAQKLVEESLNIKLEEEIYHVRYRFLLLDGHVSRSLEPEFKIYREKYARKMQQLQEIVEEIIVLSSPYRMEACQQFFNGVLGGGVHDAAFDTLVRYSVPLSGRQSYLQQYQQLCHNAKGLRQSVKRAAAREPEKRPRQHKVSVTAPSFSG